MSIKAKREAGMHAVTPSQNQLLLPPAYSMLPPTLSTPSCPEPRQVSQGTRM